MSNLYILDFYWKSGLVGAHQNTPLRKAFRGWRNSCGLRAFDTFLENLMLVSSNHITCNYSSKERSIIYGFLWYWHTSTPSPIYTTLSHTNANKLNKREKLIASWSFSSLHLQTPPHFWKPGQRPNWNCMCGHVYHSSNTTAGTCVIDQSH